jgi:hypothetical protein
MQELPKAIQNHLKIASSPGNSLSFESHMNLPLWNHSCDEKQIMVKNSLSLFGKGEKVKR